MKKKVKKLVNSFKYAIQGIFSAIKSEQNMKIHISIMILVIILGIFFKISIIEWIICIILFGLVIGSEMFNTAIETAIDMVTLEKNEKAKIAKDVSAGAVFVMAIVSIIIGIMIFLPKILNFI